MSTNIDNMVPTSTRLIRRQGDRSLPDAWLQLLIEQGARQYGYEPVTQLEHALQCAMLAEQAGEPAALVIAALFHDIGHLVDESDVTRLERGLDDRHEMRAVAALRRCFTGDVCGPVALHVAAKRFLCATEPGYLEQLSSASRQSLAVQGGVMNAAEAARFRRTRYAQAAIRLRGYDDCAKMVDCSTPPPLHFTRYWRMTFDGTSVAQR
jgi:phosphonate degradation associated HDIG domain protein